MLIPFAKTEISTFILKFCEENKQFSMKFDETEWSAIN
jgi:hypothetical protein